MIRHRPIDDSANHIGREHDPFLGREDSGLTRNVPVNKTQIIQSNFIRFKTYILNAFPELALLNF